MQKLSLLAIAGTALAIPMTRSTGYTVQQVVAGHRLPLMKSVAATYNKYGVKLPEALAAATENGSVQNFPSDAYDDSYSIHVTVGDQQFILDLDTGSSDLWVFGPKVPSSEATNHTIYKPSSSATVTDQTFSITYGDGSSASGTVSNDTVKIGGVTATKQAVEVATAVSEAFTERPIDGLIGFAFPALNTCEPEQCDTWFGTAEPELSQQLFTATLKHQAPGSYDFGSIDTSKFTGEIVYKNLNSGLFKETASGGEQYIPNQYGFWNFTVDGSTIGSKSSTKPFFAIADTGTTALLLPNSLTEKFYRQVQGAQLSNTAGGFVFPCDAKLPALSFNIGGQEFAVPADYLNLEQLGNGMCVGGLQSSGDIPSAIFGDVFLKTVFAVFDQGNKRVGFAKQA